MDEAEEVPDQLNVLVVDDTPEMRDLLVAIIHREGHQAVGAGARGDALGFGQILLHLDDIEVGRLAQIELGALRFERRGGEVEPLQPLAAAAEEAMKRLHVEMPGISGDDIATAILAAEHQG